MRVTEIHLTNFRNYTNQRIEPGPMMNIIVGPNAQGKSNLLEAVYALTTTKSHRTNRDADLIRVDTDACRIACDLVRETQNDTTLEMILSRSEKKAVKINTVKHSKIADMIGQLNSVIFSAEDLAMIKGDPSERRRFLNLEVSQLSGQYIYALGSYKRALEQRNALLKMLKTVGGSADTLSIWDEQLVTFGSILLSWRAKFVRTLAGLASPIHQQLSDGVEALHIRYEPSIPVEESDTIEDIASNFRRVITQVRGQELARGTTVKGPHRDDISFIVDDMDVRYFGSQGQQRTAALAIKLAEIHLVQEMVGESPVVLLDDVMAELDEKRRSHVFDLTCGRCQTFASATSLDEFSDEIVAEAAIFDVRKGEVTRR
jgi:DNA replication and repair protein RecF